jgi:two-component system OmpR family response regulator
MESTPHIAIVDDHKDIRELVGKYLGQHGCRVSAADSAASLRHLLQRSAPDLVVLDVMMPGEDGLSVCRYLRATSNLPVILLTAAAEETDRIIGLEIGADDYVTKPFGLAELLARVDAFMRRRRHATSARASPEDIVRFGEIEVRLASHEVFRRGERLALRPKEFELLRALIQRAGTVVTRNELLRDVWRYDSDVLTRTVDSHIVELRRQLEDDPTHPRFLITVRKSGYMLKFGDAAGVPL